MATNIIKNNKVILTNPIASKTIYPFVIDKSISIGLTDPDDSYLEVGRLYKKIKQNSNINGNLIFQCLVRDIPAPYVKSKLFIKYEISLIGGTTELLHDGQFEVAIGTLGNTTKNFEFVDSKDNTEMQILVSAINQFSMNNILANKINLAYLEIKEE